MIEFGAGRLKIGIDLSGVRPASLVESAVEGDRLGFESVWLPEHLVLTEYSTSSRQAGPPRIAPTMPLLDPFILFAYMAARTDGIRFGTGVYNLALRHPFVTARAVQTVDVVSSGRLEVGVGVGWLKEEWDAVQLNFRERGRRFEESLRICKRLWSEPSVTHDGEFFAFEDVVFLPKCAQQPWPPILIGGESKPAMARALRVGDGWIGKKHTLASAEVVVDRLRSTAARLGRGLDAFEICVSTTPVEMAAVEQWREIGVTRLIVDPTLPGLTVRDVLGLVADSVGLSRRR